MSKAILKRWVRWIVVTASVIIIVFALSLNLLRFFLPVIDSNPGKIAHWASEIFHTPVHVGTVRASWRWLNPQLELDNVTLLSSSTNQPILRIKKFAIRIDAISSLLHWKWLPGRLTIDGADLQMWEDASGQIWLSGIESLQESSAKSSAQFQHLLLWLLTQSDISIDHVNILWRNDQGLNLPMQNVRLLIDNDGTQHTIVGVANLVQKTPTQFKWIAHIKEDPLFGHKYTARLYFAARNIVLTQWLKENRLQQLLKGFQIESGDGHVQLWADLNEKGLISASTQLAISHVKLLGGLYLNQLYGKALWSPTSDGWKISASDIQLKTNNETWPLNTLVYEMHTTESNVQHEFYADNLNIEDAIPFLENLPMLPDKVRSLAEQLKPSGQLHDFDLSYGANADAQQVSLKTSGEEISLFLSQLFDHDLKFKQIGGSFFWQKDKSGTVLRLSHATLNDGNLSASGQMQLQFPVQDKPTIDLLFSFQMQNSGALAYYVPSKITSSALTHWLDDAFKQGGIQSGTLLMRGALADFPYLDHQGVFQVSAQLKGIDLQYAPGWPDLKNIAGDLEFFGQSMHTDISQAELSGNPMADLKGDIPNLNKSVLTVTGQTQSDLKDGFSFLKESPLSKDSDFVNLDTAGKMGVAIKIVADLDAKKSTVDSEGDIHVDNANLKLPSWGVELTNVTGGLSFHNSNLSSPQIKAQFFGEPVSVNVYSMQHADHAESVNLHVQSSLNIDATKKQIQSPLLQFTHGSSPLSGSLQIYNNNKLHANKFVFTSDLKGISSDLPFPFGKSSNDKRNVTVTMLDQQGQPLHTRLQYSSVLSAALDVDRASKQSHLIGGDIVLGEGKAEFHQQKRIMVHGRVDTFNWSEWQPFFSSFSTSSSVSPPADVDLEFGRIDALNQVYFDTILRVEDTSTGRDVNIDSANLSGKLFIPSDDTKPWSVRLNKLIWKKSGASSDDDASFKKLPSIDLAINNFKYNNLDLGRVLLKGTQAKTAYMIDQLDQRSDVLNMNLKGEWSEVDGQSWTTMQGLMTSENMGEIMDNIGFNDLINGGKGGMRFFLTWQGVPYKVKTKNLSGDLKLDFKNGSIMAVSEDKQKELGLGRLINIFSLSSLPRRLTLNFSDLSSKGFVFDDLKGDFHFNRGNAITKNAVVNGPVAKVSLNGRIGFAHEDYDLDVFVAPYLTSSVPLIAGIAGGPVVGAVVWAANKVLAPGIGRAVGFRYRLKGSWNKAPLLALPAPENTNQMES